MLKVPVNYGPPNTMDGEVVADPTDPRLTDLTTVTAVYLRFWGPTGTAGAYQAQILGPCTFSATPPSGTTVSTLTWVYSFLGTETPNVGDYRCTVLLSVPGHAQAIPCGPAQPFKVVQLQDL